MAKRLLCALICAVLLVCLAAPALAGDEPDKARGKHVGERTVYIKADYGVDINKLPPRNKDNWPKDTTKKEDKRSTTNRNARDLFDEFKV